jgi:hypothetical protein
VGMAVSYTTTFQDVKKLDPRLVCPVLDNVMKAMPQSFQDAIGWKLGDLLVRVEDQAFESSVFFTQVFFFFGPGSVSYMIYYAMLL